MKINGTYLINTSDGSEYEWDGEDQSFEQAVNAIKSMHPNWTSMVVTFTNPAMRPAQPSHAKTTG